MRTETCSSVWYDIIKVLCFRLAMIQQNSAECIRIKTITFVYSLPKNYCRPSCAPVGGRGRFWSNLSTWGASFNWQFLAMTQTPTQQNSLLTPSTQLTCWLFVTEPTTGDPKTSRHCASAALFPWTDELCPGEATTQTVPTYVTDKNTAVFLTHVIRPKTCKSVPHGQRKGSEIGLKAWPTFWWRKALIYSGIYSTARHKTHSTVGSDVHKSKALQTHKTVTEKVLKCKPAKRWVPKIRAAGDTTALRVGCVHDWKCSGGLQNVSDKLGVGVW
jgi:hypothetical protein